MRRMIGGTGVCTKVRVVTDKDSLKEKIRKDILAGCAECVS